MGDVIMKKKFDYSLAQERVDLATSIVNFITAAVQLGLLLIPLLSVAFNYMTKKTRMTFSPKWISKFEIKPGTWVFVPTRDSVISGIAIKNVLDYKWTKPYFYYHLREGGHVLALSFHIKSQYFVHLDLSNFFSSVNKSKITRSLKDIVGYKEARTIAIESTVRKPRDTTNKYILPFGFVQSPIIASICLHRSKLGQTLCELQNNKNTFVSVYVDDIIISTRTYEDAKEALEKVKAAAERSKFPLNSKRKKVHQKR